MNKSKFIAFLKLRTLLLTNCTEEALVEKGPTTVIEIDTNNVFGSDRFEFVLPRPFALAASFKKAEISYTCGRT
jgi:hypothetical protein